jgi:hypothetical protein
MAIFNSYVKLPEGTTHKGKDTNNENMLMTWGWSMILG